MRSAWLLPLVAAAIVRAAITITYPDSDTIWYTNNTVSLNWTTSAPDSDTYLFRALLSNTDTSILASATDIADSRNASTEHVKILLPRLTAGSGYVVSFVNTTNEAQVFATSAPFEIEEGIVPSQTSTSASATSSASANLPNAQSASQSDFPSASLKASASAGAAAKVLDIKRDTLVVGVSAMLAVAGGALLL